MSAGVDIFHMSKQKLLKSFPTKWTAISMKLCTVLLDEVTWEKKCNKDVHSGQNKKVMNSQFSLENLIPCFQGFVMRNI